jgi:tetratricopeptide (TPR) repeat protein
MRGRILDIVGRWLMWCQQHPRQAAGGFVLTTVLLIWLGYSGSRYYVARSHLRAAQEAMQRREWSEAHTQVTNCLRFWPDSCAAHYLAARAARRLELFHEASAHLDTCEHLKVCEPRGLQVEQALLRLQLGNFAETEAFLRERVTEDDPDAVEILDVLFLALLRDHRPEEAKRCLDELLRRQPNVFDFLLRYAEMAEGQGWNELAADSYQKAVNIRPDAGSARLSLVHALLLVGRHAEAMKHLEILRAEDSDNPAVLFSLARCLAWEGQRDKAAKMLDGLLANEPNNSLLLAERGWLYLQLDRPDQAEPFLRRARSLGRPDQALLVRLSDCLRLLGKHDESRSLWDEAERLRVDTARSLQLAKQIRDQKPEGADLYHELASIHLRLGNDKEALFYFDRALKKDPKHRPTHESLAQYYTKIRAFAQAAKHRRQLDTQR